MQGRFALARRWIAASILALTCVSCSRTEERDILDEIRTSGVLRYGGDIQGGEPYIYADPANPSHVVGFEVDIANAIAKELGVRAEFVQADWSNLIASLNRRTFDIAINGIETTPSRSEVVRFSRPYYVFVEEVVVRKSDTQTHSIRDLDGKRVGTLASSLAWDLLRETKAIPVAYEGVDEPFQDLQHERLDAVLLDDVIANRYGLTKSDLKLAAVVTEGTYAVAFRKHDERLFRAVDDAITKLILSGKLREILKRAQIDSPREDALASLVAPPNHSAETHGISKGQVLLFLRGALMTIFVSTLSMALAVVLGLLLALARRFAATPIRLCATAYVELFRGTPVLLQLYALYFGLSNFSPRLQLSALTAAILGLGMNYAAYESEIYRAAMDSVPNGQMEAALLLGMSLQQRLRRILLPQALRVALPGITNDFISILKDSSLVSVVTVVELTKQMMITAVDMRSWLVPGLLCAALYLAMSYPLSILSRRLELQLKERAAQ